jgi:hypothetical protein
MKIKTIGSNIQTKARAKFKTQESNPYLVVAIFKAHECNVILHPLTLLMSHHQLLYTSCLRKTTHFNF